MLFSSGLVRTAAFWVSTLLAILVAFASYRFFLLGVAQSMEIVAHNLDGNQLALYGHIGAAPAALALMPIQFMRRVRTLRPAVHRWIGRIYVAAIAVSGLSGIQLAFHTTMGPLAASGFAMLALAWLGSTSVGVAFALRRDTPNHQNWMVRSAALTFAAVTLRVYLPLSMVAGYEFDLAYPVIAWACWVPNMIGAEIYLHLKKKRQGRSLHVANTSGGSRT